MWRVTVDQSTAWPEAHYATCAAIVAHAASSGGSMHEASTATSSHRTNRASSAASFRREALPIVNRVHVAFGGEANNAARSVPSYRGCVRPSKRIRRTSMWTAFAHRVGCPCRHHVGRIAWRAVSRSGAVEARRRVIMEAGRMTVVWTLIVPAVHCPVVPRVHPRPILIPPAFVVPPAFVIVPLLLIPIVVRRRQRRWRPPWRLPWWWWRRWRRLAARRQLTGRRRRTARHSHHRRRRSRYEGWWRHECCW